MGFKVEFNNILRTDVFRSKDLNQGERYGFSKAGDRIFMDTLPIWLSRSDWTAIAEIRIVTQTRQGRRVHGEFEVLHVYNTAERRAITRMFRRMFGRA